MANDQDGVVQIIRMVLDEQAARELEQEMQASLARGTSPQKAVDNANVVKGSLNELKRAAKELLAALGLAFGIEKIVEFGRESIKVALDTRKEWSNLANSIANTGHNLDTLRPRIQAMQEAFQHAGVAGEVDFVASLNHLIFISGDVEKSLRNMNVVADVSAKLYNGDLRQGAETVAKAMMGQVTMLHRLGIDIPAGADAVKFLAERYRGAAMAVDETVREQKRLTAEWEELHEAIGNAILGTKDGESWMKKLGDTVQRMTALVDENQDAIRDLGLSLGWFAKQIIGNVVILAYEGWAAIISVVASGLAKIERANAAIDQKLGSPNTAKQFRATADEMEKFSDNAAKAVVEADALRKAILVPAAPGGGPKKRLPILPDSPVGGSVLGVGEGNPDTEIAARITLLTQELQFNDKRAEALKQLSALEKEFAGQTRDTNLTIEARAKAAEHLAAVEKAIDADRQDRLDAARNAIDFDDLRVQGMLQLLDIEDELKRKLDNGNLSFKERANTLKELKDVQDALTDGLKGIAAQAGFSEDALNKMWEGNWRAAFKSVQKDATIQAAWNIAKALEMFARSAGLFGLGNPVGGAATAESAQMHLVAAAKWAALAGAAAAGSGAAGGRSGGDAASANGALGLDAANATKQPSNIVNVYVDGINPDNADHQDRIAELNRQVRERYGEDSIVTVHNGSST